MRLYVVFYFELLLASNFRHFKCDCHVPFSDYSDEVIVIMHVCISYNAFLYVVKKAFNALEIQFSFIL